ncbi:MAG: tRNA glutamyl-Q(34) synthetase GluQRS [Bacteroidales bacterium]|nr:tRNA glutamyl-Q(34) synthetase GluQRS [Bacteroidales bacterium]
MVRGRFAPSPTGRMHLGNVYCALLSWLSAKSQGGEWLVRIEDIDTSRSRQEFIDLIFADLEWLGLHHDGIPLRQSLRSEIYQEAFDRLDTYPCFCTRADLLAASAPHASDGRHVYAGTCRGLSLEQQRVRALTKAPSFRLRLPDQDIEFNDLMRGIQRGNLAREWGDIVVKRADGGFAYQLAVVVDDAASGVTEIVRGDDLLSSSFPQIYLYQKLGGEVPRFAHVPLIYNVAGQRLAKRDKDLDMEALRQRYSPEQVIGIIANISGLRPTDAPIRGTELMEGFSWDKVTHAPAITYVAP